MSNNYDVTRNDQGPDRIFYKEYRVKSSELYVNVMRKIDIL